MNWTINRGTPLWRIMAGMVCAGLVAGCSARALQDEARKDFYEGRMQEGIAKLERAVSRDPENLALQADLKAWRRAWIAKLLALSDEARKLGRWREAEAGYRRVLDLDGDNSAARRGLEMVEQHQRHDHAVLAAKGLVEQGEFTAAATRLREVLAEDPSHSDAKKLLEEIEPRHASEKANGKKAEKPINLEFRDAKLSVIFEALSRASDINFVVDKDVKADTKATIYLKDLSVNSALDLLVAQHNLRRKVLADNTIVIYPNTPDKRKLYDEQLVKTFYLTHADPKQAMNMLKTMLDSKSLFMDEKARLVVIRDSPEVVRMAEKLVGALDMPEAEVMLEVEVLEIQRSKLMELGIKYPTSFTMTPSSGAAAATGGASAAAAFTLEDLLNLSKNEILVTPLSATANFKKDVTAADLLASPRIRARNREKAKILIGDRVPVITNSVTPTVGQPVVTGQVQYIEVGLKLEVEPIIYRDNNVSIKMTMEVSSIVREVAQTNGSLAYQIGTRTASTLLELKDGETQVLAGLISDDERELSNRLPGLGDLPIVGRLFSNQRDERKKTEIVLSITPHVVRSVPHVDSAAAEFMYGSDSSRGSSLAVKSSDDGRGILPQPQAVEPGLGGSPSTAPSRPSVPSGLFTPPPTIDPNAQYQKNESPPQHDQQDGAGSEMGIP